MIKSKFRLSRDQIKEVVLFGRTIHQKSIYLKYHPLPNLIFGALAIVVPAKLVRNVVVRNKLKRQVKNIINQYSEFLKPGWGGVLIVKLPISEINYQNLKSEINNLLTKANLILK